MPALHTRFVNHAIRLFKKHEMRTVFFGTDENDENRLIYMLAFDDIEDREKKWKAFQADDEWQRARAESVKDGPITIKGPSSASYIIKPTPYSPMQ